MKPCMSSLAIKQEELGFQSITLTELPSHTQKKNLMAFLEKSVSTTITPMTLWCWTFTDLLAPGHRLDLAGPNGTLAPFPENIGSSFAAPHVTGTVCFCSSTRRVKSQQIGMLTRTGIRL